MPYSKVSNHPKCPAEKPIGLTLTGSDKLLGCHTSKESADKQIAAIESKKHEKSLAVTGIAEELTMDENVIFYTRALPDTTNIRAEDLLKDTSLPVPFIASTEGMKSDGMDLRMSDWILGRYQNYGPILWVHDYTHPPLGTGDARKDDKLRINVTFDTDDPFAMLIRGKAIKGMMGGSVGWATTKEKKNELVEFSMVPVGIDPDALPEVQRMGLRAMQTELSEMLSEDPDESLQGYIKELRNEVMDYIVATLQEVVDEDARGKAGGEVETVIDPVEDVSPVVETEETAEEDLEEVSEEVPEETVARAGAMLSKKNREDLEKALGLIKNVIDRATPDEPVLLFSPMRGEEPEVEEPEEIIEEPEEASEEVVERDHDPNEGLQPEVMTQILEVLNQGEVL